MNRHAAGSTGAADFGLTTTATTATTAKTIRACGTIAAAGAGAAAASACGTPGGAGAAAAAAAKGIRSQISGKANDPGGDRCSIAAATSGLTTTNTTIRGTSRTTPAGSSANTCPPGKIACNFVDSLAAVATCSFPATTADAEAAAKRLGGTDRGRSPCPACPA